MRPGLVEEVEADERLRRRRCAMPATKRPRERRHAGDDRGGQRPDQRARPEVVEVLRPSRTAPASSDSDSVARPPAIAHTKVETDLRADAGEAGEVGVARPTP